MYNSWQSLQNGTWMMSNWKVGRETLQCSRCSARYFPPNLRGRVRLWGGRGSVRQLCSYRSCIQSPCLAVTVWQNLTSPFGEMCVPRGRPWYCWVGRWYVHISCQYKLLLYLAPFWLGVEPQFGRKSGRRGLMGPVISSLVTSYRLPIVTIGLSLTVFAVLRLVTDR